ncbi:MAG: hypothetical protein KJO43_06820, partial [Phycisphaerae bacterium]|nr:hypothetical protein [Phycisphaerae bacterium]
MGAACAGALLLAFDANGQAQDDPPPTEVAPTATPAEAPATDEAAPPELAPLSPVIPVLIDPPAAAGDSPIIANPPFHNITLRETIAVPDRWRIGWPRWDRYGRMANDDPVFMSNTGGDSPYTLGHPLNPYDRNVFKGDYPIDGDDIFMNATIISDTLFDLRRLPTISGVSAASSDAFDFFGDGKQVFLKQSIFASVDIFKGNT